MKENLKELILNKLRSELSEVEAAAKATKLYSQSDDLKSEGKYDTRAIEAKYLAEAQQKRVDELKSEIYILEKFKFNLSNTIQIGSIICFNNSYYSILPISGQGNIKINQQSIKTLSSTTDLSQELLGLDEGDYFEHPVTGKEVLITKII